MRQTHVARRQGDQRMPTSFRRQSRGIALLEVVLSLSILVLAMGVVGASFTNGRRSVALADRLSRAGAMTERLIVELDTGLLLIEETEQSGWFNAGETIENLSWRIEMTPDDMNPEILRLSINIYEGDPEGTDETRRRVLTTHILRVKPRAIDLERDFGMEQEQIEELVNLIPGGAAVFDPANFDPRMLAQLDMETLIELLPSLIQAFGGNLMAGQMDQILEAMRTGDASALQDMANQMQGGGQSRQPGDEAAIDAPRGPSGGGPMEGGASGNGPGGGAGGRAGPPGGGTRAPGSAEDPRQGGKGRR